MKQFIIILLIIFVCNAKKYKCYIKNNGYKTYHECANTQYMMQSEECFSECSCNFGCVRFETTNDFNCYSTKETKQKINELTYNGQKWLSLECPMNQFLDLPENLPNCCGGKINDICMGGYCGAFGNGGTTMGSIVYSLNMQYKYSHIKCKYSYSDNCYAQKICCSTPLKDQIENKKKVDNDKIVINNFGNINFGSS